MGAERRQLKASKKRWLYWGPLKALQGWPQRRPLEVSRKGWSKWSPEDVEGMAAEEAPGGVEKEVILVETPKGAEEGMVRMKLVTTLTIKDHCRRPHRTTPHWRDDIRSIHHHHHHHHRRRQIHQT